MIKAWGSAFYRSFTIPRHEKYDIDTDDNVVEQGQKEEQQADCVSLYFSL